MAAQPYLMFRVWRPRPWGSRQTLALSASGGESGGIGRYNERETLSRCDTIAERECKGTTNYII